ncbi:MAG: hypothetical protein ACW98U_09055 [Candidatus Thorarchaeota archaeon]
MDVVLIHVPIFLTTVVICGLLWFLFARMEQDDEVRLWKMVGVFLLWFLLNWPYIISQLLAPVWYEPAPVVPALHMLQFNLPAFIILSVPMVYDMLKQKHRILKSNNQ